jgi:hypothetical protein
MNHRVYALILNCDVGIFRRLCTTAAQPLLSEPCA